MSKPALEQHFDACSSHDKLILALLALAGEPMGRRRIHEYLALLEESPGDEGLAEPVARLRDAGLLLDITGRGYAIAPDTVWPAIRWSLQVHVFAT